ncbi:MAG: porin family protein [Dysgonamonadaceae bacterium]
MKKNFFLCLLLTMIAVSSYSQETTESKDSHDSKISFRFGVKGGKSRSDAQITGGYDLNHYKGYQLGAYTEITKSDINYFFLRGSILFSKRGLKYLKEETTNQYIQIPVQLGFKYPVVKFASVYAVAGPSANFRTYGSEYIKGFSPNDRWYTKKFVLGTESGVGIEFFKHIQVECSYQYGLTPDYKSSGNTARNSSLLFSAGIIF